MRMIFFERLETSIKVDGHHMSVIVFQKWLCFLKLYVFTLLWVAINLLFYFCIFTFVLLILKPFISLKLLLIPKKSNLFYTK